MTRFNPKMKFLLTLGIIFLLLFIFIVLIIYPLFSEIKKTAQKFLETQDELSILIERRERLGELERRYTKEEEASLKIKNVLANPQDPLAVILLLEDIVKKTGNTHKLSSLTHSGSEVPIPHFSFSLNLSGSFSNLMRFLKLLENMKFYADIDSLDILKTSSQEGMAPILNSSFRFKVYSR